MGIFPFGSLVSWRRSEMTKGESGNWLELIEGEGEKNIYDFGD